MLYFRFGYPPLEVVCCSSNKSSQFHKLSIYLTMPVLSLYVPTCFTCHPVLHSHFSLSSEDMQEIEALKSTGGVTAMLITIKCCELNTLTRLLRAHRTLVKF